MVVAATRDGTADRMKIVHVTLRFDAPGGVETTVREVTRRLAAAGDEVEVFASDLVDESGWVRGNAFRPAVDGVPVRRFPALRRPLSRVLDFVPFARSFSLPVMEGLAEALRGSGADVIHAHSHRYGHVLQAAAVARRHRIPLVVSTHYHPADRRESPFTRGLLRCEDVGFGMSAYRVARALVAESELEAGLVREFAPPDRIRVVPPGIDGAAWEDPSRDRTDGLDLPERYVLFVGRIASNKGLGFLLEALARFSPPERPALVLMGPDWGERPSLERRAVSLGIADYLQWLGAVPLPSMYRGVVRRALALVLPSEWEAYGLVLLDAMAAGTPIVATAVGGVPEVLARGRAGRLVPYGDAGALAAALRSVLVDRAGTDELVRNARDQARAADWSVAVERHRQLYRDVAGR